MSVTCLAPSKCVEPAKDWSLPQANTQDHSHLPRPDKAEKDPEVSQIVPDSMLVAGTLTSRTVTLGSFLVF